MRRQKNYLNPYQYIINFKNHLYDTGEFRTEKFEVPIISIGNINTGGSGKTPFIQFLSEHYKNKNILIIAKSYKAKLKAPEKVDLQRANCVERYGDEPCLLQKTLPFVSVWAGPHKTKTVVAAILQQKESKAKKFDLILVDDGFSHRKLFRTKDIVLVDSTRDWKHYRMLPLGRLREDWSSLARAHAVILTKTQTLTPEKKQKFISLISPYNENIFQAQYKIALNSENKRLFLITGIGNPQALRGDLQNQGFEIVQDRTYADHYAFPESEQKNIFFQTEVYPDLQVVMTAKDFTKMNYEPLRKKIKVVDLKVDMNKDDLRKLFEVLDA